MAITVGVSRSDTGAAGFEEAIAEESASPVSWVAIIVGAVAAVAVSLLLVALGSGIGLASVSPWSASNPTATTFTLLTAVWLIIVQWLSSATGGYLTGRLRTRWVGLHADEAFFRDTAHGFLAWAVASIVVAGLATSALSAAASGGARLVSNVASGAVAGATQGAATQSDGSTGYFVDALFRADPPRANVPPQEAQGEAARILARAVANGNLDPADRSYLAKLVAARTGMSQAEAEKRVDDVIAQEKAAEQKAREAADAARKSASAASFFTFFSMLIGAFIAAVAGAIGGRMRDQPGVH
jgi:hypothetical protein